MIQIDVRRSTISMNANSARKRGMPDLVRLGLIALMIPMLSSVLLGDELTSNIKVSWDFGSGPGKTSDYYVGERDILVRYDTAECMSRFTLEDVRYEYALVEIEGELLQQGPPFVMMQFVKHFEGEFALLPRITISQGEVKKKKKRKSTKSPEMLVFPFREKEMASPVDDWSAEGIDISIGAPGAVMNLNNPTDWNEILITCDP